MGQGIRDVSTSILGYKDTLAVSAWLTANQSRVEAAGLSTPGQSERALKNEVIDGNELKILRGRTLGLNAILDSGVSVGGYYNTIIAFYSTPEGRRFGARLDRWAQSGQVSEAEISYMTQQVYFSAKNGMTPQELARLDSEMDRLDNPGNKPTAAPAKPAAVAVAAAPAKPKPAGRVRTFTDEVNDFKRGANSTTDEELFLQQRIDHDKASGKKWTNAEVEQERALMRRLSAKGDQLTAEERASIRRPAAASGNADAAPDPPPQARAAAAEPPITAKPARYSPPDKLDEESYSELVINLGDNFTKLMPPGMADSNDAKTFMAKFNDPAFRARFIELYNSDPKYRQAIQHLCRDSAELAEIKQRRGKGGEIDPNSELGERSELLQGQFRLLLGKPEDLLNVNNVFNLQQGVSGLLDFVKSPNAMLDQMPPWLKAFLAPVWDLIQNVIGPLFSKQGLNEGLALASNAGGELFGGLFGGGNTAGNSANAPAPKVDPPKPDAALAAAKPVDAPKPSMDATPSAT